MWQKINNKINNFKLTTTWCTTF